MVGIPWISVGHTVDFPWSYRGFSLFGLVISMSGDRRSPVLKTQVLPGCTQVLPSCTCVQPGNHWFPQLYTGTTGTEEVLD